MIWIGIDLRSQLWRSHFHATEAFTSGGGVGDGDSFPTGVDGGDGLGGSEGGEVGEDGACFWGVGDAGIGASFTAEIGDLELATGGSRNVRKAGVTTAWKDGDVWLIEASGDWCEVESVFQKATHAVPRWISEVL